MSEATEGYQAPGPTVEHEKLKPFEGTFRATVKIWMGPGDPMESTGTMINRWHLTGLYLNQDYVGDRVDGPFPNFCGKGYWGFNTTSKQFEGFWIDNASTAMQMETGSVNDAGNVWTMVSTVVCPETNNNLTKRSVITLIDDNQHSMESFFAGEDGNEMKCMEIAYTRA